MIIAVDIGSQKIIAGTALPFFIKETFKRIIAQNTDTRLLLVINKEFNKNEFNFSDKVTIINRNTTSGLVPNWWLKFGLPNLLKKNKVDVFISCLPESIKKITVPQIIFVPDAQSFVLKKGEKWINQFNKIVTPSLFTKQKLAILWPELVENIFVISAGHSSEAEIYSADEIKNKYTEGRDFFACSFLGNADDKYLLVLKAFSLFKKRQQTNRKLFFLGAPPTSILKKLASYKYKVDIVISDEDLGLQKSIIAAAYALIDLSELDNWALPVLKAMNSGVPIIAFNNSAVSAYAGDAALCIDEAEPQQLAEQMMRIYKDETMHKQMKAAASQKSKDYNWDNAADKLWQLLKTTKNE